MNLQRVVLKRKRQETPSGGTTAAKQVKEAPNELYSGSPSPNSEAQRETFDAADPSVTHSEHNVCEVVEHEAESASPQDVPGVTEPNTELSTPSEVADLT